MHEPPKLWVGKNSRGQAAADLLGRPKRPDQNRRKLIQLLLSER
jgi:hypothetical protein